MTTPDAAPHQQTVLEALQASPAGPFLNMPMPGLPQLPQLPPLPPLPPNPLDALLQGQGLPALPGIDQLLKPITDLASGFGSGNLGAFDPTQIFQQSSKLIDTAMQMGMSGLKTLDQVWQGNAAQQAQAQGKQAQGNGEELSQRGTDISTVTADAAASVQRGNAKLVGIAESFATTAIAAAPVAFTPPGQAMLMAAAAEHISQAIAVVTETRAELTGHTAQMGTLAEPVPVAAGPNTGSSSPFAIASQVMEGIGKPLLSAVTENVQSLIETSTQAASVSMDGAVSGHGSSAGLGHGGGSAGGHGGGAGMAGGAGSATMPLSSGSVGSPAAAAPAGKLSSVGGAPTQAAAIGPSGMGAGGMGGGGMMPHAGRSGSDSETTHNTPGYLTDAVNKTDVVGDLGTVVAPVIGAADPDEESYVEDYDYD